MAIWLPDWFVSSAAWAPAKSDPRLSRAASGAQPLALEMAAGLEPAQGRGGARVAWDGQAYTHEEFKKYYGDAVGDRIWRRSSPEVPEVGVPMECVPSHWRGVPSHWRGPSSAHLRLVTASVKDAHLDGRREAGGQTWAGMKAYASFLLNQMPAVVLDVRCFDDPDAGQLRQHTGMHPDIIGRLLAHRRFQKWIVETVDLIMRAIGPGSRAASGAPQILLIYCNSGKHRSLACAEVLSGVLEEVGEIQCGVVERLCEWPRMCELGCTACQKGANAFYDEARSKHVQSALAMYYYRRAVANQLRISSRA